jgi:hypothetical protein
MKNQTMPASPVHPGEQITEMGGRHTPAGRPTHAINDQFTNEIRLHGGLGADLYVALPG